MKPLRDQIAQALTQADIDADVDLEGPGYYHKQAGYVLALVADPALRMLWLAAMHLEVREGYLHTYNQPQGVISWDVFPEGMAEGDVPVLVVRPRSEATDG